MKKIGEVFEETDYSKFKRLEENRDVLKARCDRLVNSFSEKIILNPIIVNEKMEIIDGQGRYEAMKILGIPIPYIIAPGTTINDCRLLNSYNSKWSDLDFAKSYAEGGNQNYTNLLTVCKLTDLSISRALRFTNHTAHTDVRAKKRGALKEGGLMFTEKDIETVINVKKHCDEIAKALCYEKGLNDAFYTAVKVIMEFEGYDHKRMIRNCEKNRSGYAQMGRLVDQLKEFERIYNKGAKTGRIYFSDYMRNKGLDVRDYDSTITEYRDINVSTLQKSNKEENEEEDEHQDS